MRILGFLSKARAMAMRCFCPPDSRYNEDNSNNNENNKDSNKQQNKWRLSEQRTGKDGSKSYLTTLAYQRVETVRKLFDELAGIGLPSGFLDSLHRCVWVTVRDVSSNGA
eukprot:m.127598 g.127598  ORF g.127598 m.127598 type:complete len:110 (+) comp52269_c0_seq8:543-872(+)